MMVNIMKRMREEFSPGNRKRICESLAVELGEVWDRFLDFLLYLIEK